MLLAPMTPVPERLQLASGAEARVTNGLRAATVVWLGGGRNAEEPGTWSASNEWLVQRLSPRFPELGFVEVRYRVKSWQRAELGVLEARAGLEVVAPAQEDAVVLQPRQPAPACPGRLPAPIVRHVRRQL
jgi:hypothetical protein